MRRNEAAVKAGRRNNQAFRQPLGYLKNEVSEGSGVSAELKREKQPALCLKHVQTALYLLVWGSSFAAIRFADLNFTEAYAFR